MEFQTGQKIVWMDAISQVKITGEILLVSDKYLWIDILTGNGETGIRRFEIEKIEIIQDGKDSTNLKIIRLRTDSVHTESESKCGSRVEALYQRISRKKETNKIKEILRDFFEI